MNDVAEALARVADPDAAVVLARYFQVRPGGYGEGDQFIGVKISRIRPLVRSYGRLPFRIEDWSALLTSPVHEHRLAALVVMSERARRADPAECEHLYLSYLAHTRYVNNWDLVDVSAGPVVGRYLLDRSRTPLYELARSRWLWDRRIAMVATQGLIAAGDTADVYGLADALRHDDHDLIHKAVGWMLREAGKRVSAVELRNYLDRRAAELPRTTLRYAIEHFDRDERACYLALR